MRCFSVTGYSGGSLLVDFGEFWSSDSVKYMDKLTEWRRIKNDKKHDQWINEGRLSMYRNSKGNLLIFIRELNQRDAGRYRIGVSGRGLIYEFNWGRGKFH